MAQLLCLTHGGKGPRTGDKKRGRRLRGWGYHGMAGGQGKDGICDAPFEVMRNWVFSRKRSLVQC